MKKVGIGQWILGLVLFLYTMICLLPVILVVIVSFSSDESINKNGFSFFPEQWSLKAWEYVGSFGRQLINSYNRRNSSRSDYHVHVRVYVEPQKL